MAIKVDTNGDGIYDLDDDPLTPLPGLSDISGDTKPDVDLRIQGSSALISGVRFGGGILNAGTGNFNDFLGMQNSGTEYGFNSAITNDPSNPYLKTSTNFTHTILLSDIAITTINGVQYYDFRLDVNESNANPTTQQISLDSFQLYTSNSGTIGTLSALQAQNLVYDMDSGGDVSVLFTDAYSSGSGRSDLSVLVPVASFGGANPTTTYLYLYSAFGFAGTNFNTDATFEEWRTQNAVILHGVKFNDSSHLGVKDGNEVGVGGVTINLFEDTNGNGVLDGGDQILQTTTTDAQGNYTFYGVKTAATYFIDEVTPAGSTQTTGDYETITVSKNATIGSTLQVDPIGNHYPTPHISIDKAFVNVTDGPDNGSSTAVIDGASDVANYTIAVTNDGETALTNVNVTDALATSGAVAVTKIVGGNTFNQGDADSDGVLDIGETWLYTATQAATQSDLDTRGGGDNHLDNSATVVATQQGTANTVTATDTAFAPIVATPSIAITKVFVDWSGGNGNTLGDAAGDIGTYTIVVTNTGNVTLTNVVVKDPLTGDTYNVGSLAPGAASAPISEHYTLTQADLDSNGTLEANSILSGSIENTATATSSQTGPASASAVAPITYNPDFTVVKAVTAIDGGNGGQADSASDVIHYSVTVANTGNITLTGFSYTDANADSGTITLASGDTNHDGNLDVGETWTFNAVHTVTQAELDGRGSSITGAIDGDGDIDNQVTVDFTQTDPKSSAVATPLLYDPAIDVTKVVTTIDGGHDGKADSAGDVINYAITIANTGNVSLSGVTVTDKVEGYGATDAVAVTVVHGGADYNSGDANFDGLLSVGETWNYTASYTVTQADLDGQGSGDGLIDNVATGDTAQTEPDTAEASAPLLYDPAIDVTKVVTTIDGGHDGKADSAGDVINYAITIANTGNVSLSGVTVTDKVEGYGATDAVAVTVVHGGADYNSGDANFDGLLSVGETWNYTASYTVTQADLDGQGSGDGLIDNVATGDTAQTEPDTAEASAPLLYNPNFSVVKAVSSITDGADWGASGQADSAGDKINYSITVANTGNITLTGFSYSDANADSGTITLVNGDTNHDGNLDVGETWTFSAIHTVTQAELDGRGSSITGAIDGDGDIDNQVTVDFTQTDPKSSAVATPLVYHPGVDITKYVSVDAGAGYLPWDDANAVTGPETSVDTAVRFKVVLTNTGNVTLTGIHLSDLLHDYASNTNSPINYTTVNAGVDLNNDGTVDASWASLDANNDGTLDTTSLAVGGSITVYYNLDFVEGQHTNTATVTTTQGVTDTDAANYYGLHVNTEPGVRTPGFWNHWTNLWDGTAVGDPKQMGQPGFPGQDVLYKVDSNGDGVIDGNDKAGLLIGDWNMDGKQSVGEDVIFISLNAARSLVGAANKTVGNDGVQILGRDLIASWLNFIEGNAIDAPGTADDSHNPQHFIQDAINYLQTYAGSDSDSPATDTFDVFKFDVHKVTKTSSTYWNTPLGVGGDAHTGAAIHSALDTYNNTGTIDGIMYAGSADNATFLAALSQAQMP